MNIPEKQQNNDDGHAPLSAAQGLRVCLPRILGGDSVAGGRLPVAGGGLLGGAGAGCAVPRRITLCSAAGAVLVGAALLSAVLFLASPEGNSTLYSGTVYSGSFNGCFGVRSDIVIPFSPGTHPALQCTGRALKSLTPRI